MTNNEARGFILGKLNCMERCDRFDCNNTDECDNCEYCYSQGNFGEQKKAFRFAINALEKQIPKKPDFTEDKEFALCPCCNGNGLFNKQKYCEFCGQKLDWSDEE